LEAGEFRFSSSDLNASCSFQLTFALSLLQVHFIASSTAKMLGLPPIEDSEVVLDARFNAGIYGLADEATLKAIKIVRPLSSSYRLLIPSTKLTSSAFYFAGCRDRGLHHRSGLRGKEHGWFDLAGRVSGDSLHFQCSVHPPRRPERSQRSGKLIMFPWFVANDLISRQTDLHLAFSPFSFQCALA